jgi:hypothetical protein
MVRLGFTGESLIERIARLGLTDVLTLASPHMDGAADVDNE